MTVSHAQFFDGFSRKSDPEDDLEIRCVKRFLQLAQVINPPRGKPLRFNDLDKLIPNMPVRLTCSRVASLGRKTQAKEVKEYQKPVHAMGARVLLSPNLIKKTKFYGMWLDFRSHDPEDRRPTAMIFACVGTLLALHNWEARVRHAKTSFLHIDDEPFARLSTYDCLITEIVSSCIN